MNEISWTDETWNPSTGCDRVSAGCDHCYAMTMARRLKGMGAKAYQVDGDPRTSGPGFGVQVHPDRLALPFTWRKPKMVFVNSMSDLFHKDVPVDFIARVFGVMALAPQHTFQILTKRHARMRSVLTSEEFLSNRYVSVHANTGPWPLPNVWLGVSVEDQQWADIRIPALLDTPAAIRFLSCEPLLGSVRISAAWMPIPADFHTVETSDLLGLAKWMGNGIDWVIAGGESGPGARPMRSEWVRDIRDQCAAAGVAFHFKQAGTVLAKEWGGKGKGGDPAGWPESFPREYPAVSA